MFVGHLAVGMIARRIEPRVPLGTAVAAAFGLDLLWPILLLVGLETVAIHPGDTKFTSLEFVSYPWSHSLLMAAVWSALAGAAAWRVIGTRRPAIVVGLLVLSHWVLDFVTHRPDLPLWPGGPLVGLGMWNSIADTLFVEGTLLGFGLWHYHRARPGADRIGRWALRGLVLLTTVIWASQPWSPPPPSATAVAWGGLVGWLLPLWARWADSHRTAVALPVLLALLVPASIAQAQGGPPDEPAVTVRGQVYTPRSILARNMGSDEDQTTAFAPHRIVGNVYYVGTRTLSSFLVTTPAGHILINTTYERNVRTIARSVEQLGFRFADVRLILGTHAHADHQEGDALAKESTGAQVLAMAEDVPALMAIRPGGKAHPLDRQLKDGEQVTLGGVVLTARLTPGHTRGCTTWTTKVAEGGRDLDVVFACSYRAPAAVTPEIEAEFARTFQLVRTLPCDVPLGDHPAQYRMAEKHARLQTGGPNPFVDAEGCWLEADVQEAMLRAQLRLQRERR